MIPLYLCDDDLQVLEHIKKIVENIIMIHNFDIEIVLASENPKAILEHKKTQIHRSIYLLDVELKDAAYNGFSLGKELRSMDPRGFIIYISTHEELMVETFKYKLEAMSYLIKDDICTLREQISDCFLEIIKLAADNNKDVCSYYCIKANDKNYHIPVKDILFFETAGPHRVAAHTLSRMIEFRGDLGRIEKELKDSFVRSHQSYLVQLNQIEQIDCLHNTIELKGGGLCLLSKKGKKILKQSLDVQGEKR